MTVDWKLLCVGAGRMQGKARDPKAGGQGHSRLSKQMVTKKNTKSSWVAVGYFN